MGFEVALILTAVSAVSKISQANSQAKQVIEQGNIEAANKGKEVRYKAAKATSSFLNSGLTLNNDDTTGTTVNSIYDTGIQDINQIRSNYNTRAKNVITEGRNAALATLASGFSTASLGGELFDKAGSWFSGAGKTTANGFTNASGGVLDSAVGGIAPDSAFGDSMFNTILEPPKFDM